MADYKGNQDKLIDSDYLYKQFKNFDARRADKLDKALFITTPEHYEQNDGLDPSALEIIADGTGVVGNQIELSNVTPVLPDTYTPQIGEYVVLVPEAKEDIYLKSSTLSHETENLDLDTLDTI